MTPDIVSGRETSATCLSFPLFSVRVSKPIWSKFTAAAAAASSVHFSWKRRVQIWPPKVYTSNNDLYCFWRLPIARYSHWEKKYLKNHLVEQCGKKMTDKVLHAAFTSFKETWKWVQELPVLHNTYVVYINKSYSASVFMFIFYHMILEIFSSSKIKKKSYIKFHFNAFLCYWWRLWLQITKNKIIVCKPYLVNKNKKNLKNF